MALQPGSSLRPHTVADLADTDSERAIQWVDRAHGAYLRSAGHRPDRGGFGAAANRRLRPHLVCGTFDSCRADAIERHSA